MIGSFPILGALAVVLVTACGGGSDISSPRTETDRSVACKGEWLNPLVGDVDGDGSADEASIELRAGADGGCQFQLVMKTSVGQHVTDLEYSILQRSNLESLRTNRVPSVTALVPVDQKPGSEVLVTVTRGASTKSAVLFTLHGDKLTSVRAAKDGKELVINYGGSVAHLNGVDCVASSKSRQLVMSSLVEENLSGTVWTVRREFVDVRNSTFRVANTTTEVHKSTFEELARRFPEFSDEPFASCGRLVPNAQE